jgi:hypothetical protein
MNGCATLVTLIAEELHFAFRRGVHMNWFIQYALTHQEAVSQHFQ